MAEPAFALPETRLPERLERQLGGATGSGVRVAVIDSGRDPAWSDPRIRPGIGLVDGLELHRSEDDRDRVGHGTACIDIILGLAPEVEILPLRVFESRLETSPEVIVAALDHAVEEGAGVINLSLGCLLDRAVRPLYLACERARQAGAVVVSAVHPGEGWSYPAIFDNTLGVAAGRFAGIYDFEYFPDDGVECRAQGERRVRWLGEPRRVYGSSFAAPHISALVALLKERTPDNDLEQIRASLARLALRR